ncbi:tetratricopeptide repeat protein [Desulfococcaceae bacterium HSG9]|nr:tetratricopeptide repeat protein [Desulfococcaceae bacterium HSG9]
MNRPAAQSDYFAGINKIVRFFKLTKGCGLLFCACTDQRMVREINRTLLKRAQNNQINIREVYVPSEKSGEIIAVLREATHGSDGLIVNNLDELVLTGGKEFVHQINFARELIIDLNLPLLFWLTPENISVFANSAPDLFSRRDRGVIEFAGTFTGDTALRRFDETLALVYAQTDDFKSLRLKIELLEKQYQEAKAKGYPAKRIALEIAADLIDAYLKVHLRQEASELFEQYRTHYEESSEPRLVWLTARVFDETGSWNKALEYYHKAEQIKIEVGDRAGLGRAYNNIGIIYSKKGEWDKALEVYQKAEQIYIEIGHRAWLGRAYNNIGIIYSKKGEWDKALQFYQKAEQIKIEVGDRTRLGGTYNNIGTLYYNKGEWNKALEFYQKAEQIGIEVGDRAGFGVTYNAIGLIYKYKGEWDKALEFYQKSEQIRIEVGDRAGLAYTWFNSGTIMQKQNNTGGDAYICAAAYLAESLGMTYEQYEMAWAIDPLVEKLGRKKVMKIGKKFYEERVANYQTESD